MRNCTCGGVLIKGKSSYSVSEDHFTFILEDIPAYNCQRCGKVLFDDETVNRIQKIVRRLKKETKEIITESDSVNLYEY